MAIIVVNGVPRFQDDSRSVYITLIYHACGDTSEVIT
jgi:hypothetical protein